MTGKLERKGRHFFHRSLSPALRFWSQHPIKNICIDPASSSLIAYKYPPVSVPALVTCHKPKDWFSRMSMCRTGLSVLLVIQAVGVALVTATTCYKYSNQIETSGTDDSGDTPCDPNASVSACCGAGSICISNLHCYNEYIKINVPGTCTDQSFTDPACPCPPSE